MHPQPDQSLHSTYFPGHSLDSRLLHSFTPDSKLFVSQILTSNYYYTTHQIKCSRNVLRLGLKALASAAFTSNIWHWPWPGLGAHCPAAKKRWTSPYAHYKTSHNAVTVSHDAASVNNESLNPTSTSSHLDTLSLDYPLLAAPPQLCLLWEWVLLPYVVSHHLTLFIHDFILRLSLDLKKLASYSSSEQSPGLGLKILASFNITATHRL